MEWADDQMRSLLNRLFDLDSLAAKLACENVQVLGLREDVQFLAVGTLNRQFALGVEGRCFPGFAHDLDFLTAIKLMAWSLTISVSLSGGRVQNVSCAGAGPGVATSSGTPERIAGRGALAACRSSLRLSDNPIGNSWYMYQNRWTGSVFRWTGGTRRNMESATY